MTPAKPNKVPTVIKAAAPIVPQALDLLQQPWVNELAKYTTGTSNYVVNLNAAGSGVSYLAPVSGSQSYSASALTTQAGRI